MSTTALHAATPNTEKAKPSDPVSFRWERICTPCVAEILSLLTSSQAITKSELFKRVHRSRQTIHHATEFLLEYGFVEVVQEERFPKRKFHRLSPDGRTLAASPLGLLPSIRPINQQ